MSFLQGLEYVQTIMPTRPNAVAIQKLTLQDVEAGGFPNPRNLADPLSHHRVAIQWQKLREHPGRYSGYVSDGELVAYIKQNHWHVDDELPFATGARAVAYRVARKVHLNPSTGQWGIFGLVASDELEPAVREAVLSDLLQRSFQDPVSKENRTVNMVIHERDPLLKIAIRRGFVPVGKLAEAAGAPGLKQRRYQRLATD